MSSISKAQQKFVAFLKKKDPNLTDKDVYSLLDGFKRFVKVVHKIYTEPQAQFTIKERKIGGKTIKNKVITADFAELKKVFDKAKKKHNIVEVFQKFEKAVTKDKYGR